MHYLIGRDLDGDGYYEYIKDIDDMILTENPVEALQFTKSELDYIDMSYLNQYGFFAVEATNLVAYTLSRLFKPLTTAYRPRVAPPPRRPRPLVSPRPRVRRGPMGPVVPAPRRPRNVARAAAPRPLPPSAKPPRPAGPARPAAPARPVGPVATRPAAPARPSGPAAKRPAGPARGPKGPTGRGGRGPGF